MTYAATTNSHFLSTVRQWIDTSGEVLAMIRYNAAGGSKSYEFFHTFSAFLERMADLRPRTCVIIFRDRQLSHRGTVDGEFLSAALNLVPDGEEWLVAALELTIMGSAWWFDSCADETHEELRIALGDRMGQSCAFGAYPPWLEDNDAVISAVVPEANGAVISGIY